FASHGFRYESLQEHQSVDGKRRIEIADRRSQYAHNQVRVACDTDTQMRASRCRCVDLGLRGGPKGLLLNVTDHTDNARVNIRIVDDGLSQRIEARKVVLGEGLVDDHLASLTIAFPLQAPATE